MAPGPGAPRNSLLRDALVILGVLLAFALTGLYMLGDYTKKLNTRPQMQREVVAPDGRSPLK